MDGSFLIVEDDIGVAKSVARIIAGVRPCVLAHDAKAAEKALQEDRRWVGFLIDVVLGKDKDKDATGFDVLELARKRHPNVPAAIMTAHVEREYPNRAYALGGTFLAKPIDPDLVRRFIGEALTSDLGLEEPLRTHIGALATKHGLSDAELEVLALAMRFESSERIAVIRGVSRNTHKTLVRKLLRKLEVTTLLEASRKVLTELEWKPGDKGAKR